MAAPGSSTNLTRFELATDDGCRSLSSVTVLMVAEHPDGVQRFVYDARGVCGTYGDCGERVRQWFDTHHAGPGCAGVVRVEC